MRILNLSNFYPPHSRGGYEQWCQEIAEGLRSKGHTVSVLTSRFSGGRQEQQDPSWVHRELRLEMEFAWFRNSVQFFTSRHAHERENLDRLRALVDALDPDCILIWGMWNLHRSLAAVAERLRPNRVAYYVGDYWPTLPSQYEPYWASPGRNWMTGAVKAPLRVAAMRAMAQEPVPRLEFRHAMFPTAFVRDELSRRGVRALHSRVVYGAIDTGLYTSEGDRRTTIPRRSPRLLWVGRLTPDKGIDTAIEAMGILVRQYGMTDATLAVVGSGDPSYESGLRTLARERGVGHLVRFLGPQPKEAMAGLYRDADVFLFTSVWPEPFGRTVVEAMASRLVVIGTRTGGAGEILVDGRNALTFEPGDADALALRAVRLARDPVLCGELACRGRQEALEQFDISRMALEIEDFLRRMVDAASAAHDSIGDVRPTAAR